MKLTEKENCLFQAHLKVAHEECGATTIEELLEDNHSCATIKDFRRLTGFSKHIIAGLISSLCEKNVMWIEPREKTEGLPDLYWIEDNYLKSLCHLKLLKEVYK